MPYNTLIRNAPMTLKEKKALLKRLEQAGTTCMDCGQKYGQYHDGVSSVWNGKCGICGEEKRVTETRDFRYMRKGILQLKEEIALEKKTK